MINFRPHEYALLFPAMTDQEFTELKDSIAKDGLVDDIVLYEGKILDGVHRDKACRELGMDINTRYANWDDLQESIKKIGPLRYVAAKNKQRRHLTVEQRVELALKLLPLLQQEARERELSGRVASPEARGKAAEKAAKMAGVSTSTVERAVAKQKKSKSVDAINKELGTGKPPKKSTAELARNEKWKATHQLEWAWEASNTRQRTKFLKQHCGELNDEER
jgi:transposase